MKNTETTKRKTRRFRGGVSEREDRSGFWILYRDADNKRKREKVDVQTAQQARGVRAMRVTQAIQIRNGVIPRPAPERIPKTETLRHVADQFMANQKNRLSPKGFEREQ